MIAERSPISAAILLREAARASRQWRTYASRALFSGLLMSVVVATVGVSTTAIGVFGAPDPANFGSMGRNLFLGFAAIEVLIAMVLAPIMVSRSVIEEREERTLDLIVLSHLTPAQILLAKIASSLLVIAMIVLGGLPILALVVSLGGVSVVEVLAVTADALAALVLLGTLGGFFALFTRSQALATVAALVWALPVFLIVPWLYVAATGLVDGATYMSPLYGTAARGWAALLPAVAYVPVLVRVLLIGTNVFAMRTANVTFGRLFHKDVWRTTPWLVEGGILLVTGVLGLPFAVVGSWSVVLAQSAGSLPGSTDEVVAFLSRGAIWVWAVYATSWTAWIYLRLGAEWVIALESMFNWKAGPRERAARTKKPPAIGANPVLWQEARPRQFGTYSVGVVIWGVVMWGAFQSFLWVIPGGLLTLGLLNVGAAWFGAAYIAANTIERERREGTLELLLTTTLPAWQVVVGKLAGIALPTFPLAVVGGLLLILGLPQAHMIRLIDRDGDEALGLFIRGGTVGLWCVAFYLFILCASMCVAVRVPNPKAAFAVNLGGVLAMLVFPWMVSVAFGSVEPVFVAMRALVPVVGVRGPWWEPLLSASALSVAALALFSLLCLRLRTWSAAVM